jgi:hypothetical protein
MGYYNFILNSETETFPVDRVAELKVYTLISGLSYLFYNFLKTLHLKRATGSTTKTYIT